MTKHKFFTKLTHLIMISLMIMQSLVYPWISLLPAPPGANAQESPPIEASHSAETPAPSPLDPLLNLDTIFTSTNSAEIIKPEELPEATPSATPEPTPEAIITPSSTPSASPVSSPSPLPTDFPSNSTIPVQSPAPSITPTPSLASPSTPTPEPSVVVTPPTLDPFFIDLVYPFIGSYPLSYKFAEESSFSYVRLMQNLFKVESHDGLDFAMEIGNTIVAASSGTVISAGPGLYGTTIVLQHNWGRSYYGHLSETKVNPGDKVVKGQEIALSGNSGITTGPHLHFGIRPNHYDLQNGFHGMIDPLPYLTGTILGASSPARVKKDFAHLFNNTLKVEDPTLSIALDNTTEDLIFTLKDPRGQSKIIYPTFYNPGTGDTAIVERPNPFIPGLYTLTVEKSDHTFDEQTFSWGVLALNPDQSIYSPDQRANLAFAVLDGHGEMVCDAQLDLAIISPSGFTQTLTTANQEIGINYDTCQSKELTITPDYQTSFIPHEVGEYTLTLTSTTPTSTNTIIDYLTVQEAPMYSLKRLSATRIYPAHNYPVIFSITPKSDYQGTFVEQIPTEFAISSLTETQLKDWAQDTNDSQFITTEFHKTDTQLSWELSLKADQTYYFGYAYDAPDESPELYNLGPATIGDWQENRSWSIAVDAVLKSVGYFSPPAIWTDTGDGNLSINQPDPRSGDLMVATIAIRPNTSTINTPSGWTLLDSQTGTDGGAEGLDVGSVGLYTFYKIADGTENSTPQTFTESGTTSVWMGYINKFRSSTGTYDISAGNYAINGNATNWNGTLDTDIGLTKGDVVLILAAQTGNPSATSAWDISATGIISKSSTNEHGEYSTNTGNDVEVGIATSQIWDGTNTATPTITLTQSVATSGVVMAVRVRQGSGTNRTDSWVRSAGPQIAGTTSVAVAYPEHVIGDLLLLFVGSRATADNTPTTPTGWTSLGSFNGGSGVFGVDAGNSRTTVFYQQTPLNMTGTQTVAITSGNVAVGQIIAVHHDGNVNWNLDSDGGTDTTVDTAWSVTGAGIDLDSANGGDIVLIGSSINTDAYTYDTPTFSATGMGIGEVTVTGQYNTTSGNDMALTVATARITSGSSAGVVPTYGMTASATAGSAPAGSSMFIKINTTAITTDTKHLGSFSPPITWTAAGNANLALPQPNPQSGDLMLATIAIRPSASTVNTPTGWTVLGNQTGTDSGAEGADTGSVRLYTFYKVASGSEGTATQTFTENGTTSVWLGNIHKVRSATGTYDLNSGGYSINGDATNWNGTLGTDIGLTQGDLVYVVAAQNGDLSASSAWDLAATGVTSKSTVNEQGEFANTTGNDVEIDLATTQIWEGTNTATPTITLTQGTAASGAVMAVRIRQGSGTNRTDSWVRSTGVPVAGGGSAIVPYPDHEIGDLLVLFIGARSTTDVTPATPTGWISLGSYNGGSGVFGADAGNARTTAFYLDTGMRMTGSLSVSVVGGNSVTGQMIAIHNDSDVNWDFDIDGGTDSTVNTAWSVAGAGIDLDNSNGGGDLLITGSTINTDAYTYATPTLTATGMTFSGLTLENQYVTTNGNDSSLTISSARVATGSNSNVAPTYDMTASGTLASAPAGTSMFVRVRSLPRTITISGTANGNDGATVKLAINSTIKSQTATIGSGVWSITSVLEPTVDDIVTVWVDAVTDSNETTAVTKWNNTDITGMVLNTNVLTIGSDQNTSISLANLNSYDCTEDEDIMHQAASSHLKIEGDACAGSTTNTYTSEKLEILSGDSMTVSTTETVTTYDLTLAGTLTSSGNSTYNISHDWANTGSFTQGTSTVNLTGADSSTQTLSGTTTFYNLSASTSSNSAGRTITHTAGTTQTVTGTWTITGFTSKVITLGSSAASAWTINPTAASVDYASISYSTNSGTAFCATHSTDGGNNIGWSTSTGAACVVDPAFEASATADTTTTSATDVQMDSMSLTPGAGDYVIQFSTSITGPSASNSTQYVSIYVNNVKVDHSEREVFTEESFNLGSVDAFPTTTQAYVSGVGASHVIEVRWRTTAPTATAHERVLTVRRVDSADMSQATATADTTTTSTSYVQMDSMTLTPGAGDYLVQFSTSIAGPGTTDTTQLASLYVGGSKITHTERRVFTEGSFDVSPFNSFPTSFQAFIPNVGASDVIEVKWNTSSGTATAHERTLTIEKVANSTMIEATRVNSVTTTSATDTQLTDMTLTPGAGDYIAMFSSTFESNTVSTTQYASIYVDGSQIARSQREVYTEDSFPSTAIPTSTHIYLPGITASQVIEVKWNTTGGTATSYQSTLTLQKVSGNSVDAPTDPTSLTQLTPANATLATGDYHDETSIKFTVSASDPEASDTLYLCVEKDIVTRPFSYTNDGCGSGVAYSGSPVTLSATISNQIDASQYHWHARVKDSAGNYSNWVSYGANTETTRDYGVLTNAQVYETHSTTDVTTTAEPSDILLEDMTLTPGAGDFVVQFSSSITTQIILSGATQLVSIFVGGSQVAHTVRRIYTEESYNTGNAFPVSTQAYISGVTSGQIVEIKWNTDAGTSTSHERTLTIAKVNSANMFQATATADTTTSSTTDVQMDSMTLTPGAGDYLVMFSTSITGPGPTSSSQYASIYVDGVQATHTLRRVDTTTSHNLGLLNSFPVTAQAYVPSVTAGQVIEVKWRTAAGTATGHERTLTVQKVTSSTMAEATATTSTTSTSTTDVQMTGMTLTPGAGDYLIMFSSSLRGDTDQSTQIASIYVGGVRVDQSARSSFTETSFTNDYFGFATHAYVTGVGASDVIEVKWKTSAGTASAYNRTLTVRNVISSNTAPNSPTSLAQKTTGDVAISTGNWHNNTSVKFTATATDTDNPDTLYLCIEADFLGVSFSNTEDSCGTGVSYTGSGITVTHTLTLTDANEYHWQARVKDTAGAYSAWVSYDVNAESARDIGIDTTAPTGGTVYDGTGAGVDVSYSDSSLSALSANWGSINSNVSGLVKYEYSIGTTVGGTDIKTWTDNTTSTSVTATGLTLSSSTMYYFNVRTTDGAGNVSTPISSNGQRVAPSISFTIAPAALTFSNLNFANSYTDTQATTLTTSTNAYNGYVIRAFTTDLLRSTDTLTTIADFSAGSYATPATWAGAETGFGYTSSDTTIGGANKFGTASLYAPFSHTGPGDIIADHTNTVSGTPVSNEVFTLTYKVKVPASQAAKSYAATVIYTATAQY